MESETLSLKANIMNKIFNLGLVCGVILSFVMILMSSTSVTPAHATSNTSRHQMLSVIVNEMPSSPIPMASTVIVRKSATTQVKVADNGHHNCYDYGMYTGGTDTVHICE